VEPLLREEKGEHYFVLRGIDPITPEMMEKRKKAYY
jgi:hypothetical protein